MVKICVLGTGPVFEAMKKVSGLVDTEIVNTTAEADLVVAGSLRDFESSFSKNKFYFIITLDNQPLGNMPENVTVFKAPFHLTEYYELISRISERLAGGEEKAEERTEEIIPEVPLLPDAKRILVIDDMLQNIVSAKKLLAGHSLTVVDGYENAMEILGKEKFDVVLSDLYLPMSSKTLGSDAFRIGEEVPSGFLLVLEAARTGASYVAVVTDLNHHADHFSAAFDHFSRFAFKVENAKVKMLHARMDGGCKDWKDALDRVMKD